MSPTPKRKARVSTLMGIGLRGAPQEASHVDNLGVQTVTVPEPTPEVAQPAAPKPEPDPDEGKETETSEPALKAVPDAPSEPAAKPKRAARPRKTAGKVTAQSARDAISEAFVSARRDSQDWGPAPIRLRADLKHRLDERLARDQIATGNYSLALCHYHSAALAQVPEDVEGAAAMALAHLDAMGVERMETSGSGTRLHKDVRDKMRRLPAQLRAHRRHGLVQHVQCAALAQLLDALDSADETPPAD